MEAVSLTSKQKSELGVNAEAQFITEEELEKKLERASKLKVLSFDNTEVTTLSDRYAIEKLRMMHFQNCNMTLIEAPRLFTLAGKFLKKVNLSHNRLMQIPAEMF